MAWVKFEAARVKRLEKFHHFRLVMGWSSVEALGFLGSFWGEAIEVCESGDVSGWTPGFVSELTGLSVGVSGRAWEALAQHGWLDRSEDGKMLIHDWVDVAGGYLRKKYEGKEGTPGHVKLTTIWALHGLVYGAPRGLPTGNRPETDRKPTVDKTRLDENRPSTEGTARGRPPAFAPPTLAEVLAYCQERRALGKKAVDAEKWFNHYTANGWMVGRNKMKNWRAAVHTWEREDGWGAPRTERPVAAAGKYASVGERHEIS